MEHTDVQVVDLVLYSVVMRFNSVLDDSKVDFTQQKVIVYSVTIVYGVTH